METSSGVEGEPGRVAVREFTSSEDGELFISRLEGLPSQWLAMIRSHAPPSTIDHLVAIIRRDRSATLWVNECAVMLRMRAARSVQAGEAVYENDLVDVDALTFEGVEFPKDAGFLCVFSAGWRKGLFFDFGPILPEPVPLEYDVSKTLGSCMAYLWSQRVFSLDGADWSYLIDRQWFPFVSLSPPLRRKLVAFAKQRQDLDRLLPEVSAEVTRNLEPMISRWSASPYFREHLPLVQHAITEFKEQDYLSCTSIFYPRIEGLLRGLHQSLGVSDRATQKVLTATAVRARSAEHHPYSWLLPDMFRRYMEDAYFASFAPGTSAALSRNSIGHGVATMAQFDLKAASLGLLILDQLCYFMPAVETG